MPLTDQGYEATRFNELLERIRAGLETATGTPISSNPDTVFGVVNSILANELSVLENNIQALSSNLDIDKAEELYLDTLVRYINLFRLAAQHAKGNLKVWRNVVGTIATSTRFSDTAGTIYLCPQLQHEISSCAEFLLTPINVVEDLTYTVSVNGAIFSYTATGTDTATEVVDYFVTQIINTLAITATNENDALRVVGADSALNSLNASRINFTITEVATFNDCESLESGFLRVSLDTITQVVTNNASLLRVNNPNEFVSGRDLETDTELRKRHSESLSQSGAATLSSVLASLLALNNVTDVFIKENNTLVDEVGGLPAKSYECVVVDGDPDNIAQEIWDTKPLSVETYGTISTVVIDAFNNPQTVSWSRAETLYIFVEVSYSLYDEESFPTDGEALIVQAVLDYGNTLTLDNDVIPNRFLGGIYQTVDGIDALEVRVGFSTDVNDTAPSSGYGTAKIPVTALQLPLFTTAKVEVIAL